MDWGNLAGIALQTLTIVGSLWAFVMRLHVDLKLWIQQSQAVAEKVAKIENKMEKMAELITQLAIQDTRLNIIEARVQNIDDRLANHVKNEP